MIRIILDSAIDCALTTRDMYNQGIFPIKKPKNIFDKDSDTESQIVGTFNEIMNICNLQPGKQCNPATSEVTHIFAMTDGDIDGDLIAISVLAMLAKHCRPVVDAGMIGRIVPPAYSFTEGKKKVFVRNQRDFYQHLGKSFVKKHTLKKKGKTYDKKQFTRFIEMNFEYNSRLAKLADRYTCDPKLMEYIASKYHGEQKDQKQSYWRKVLNMYPDLNIIKEEGYILIDGTIGMTPYHIALDDYFHKHVTKFKTFQNLNSSIDGFELDDVPCTIYDIMKEFDKHMPADVKRYKGLGELDPEDMKALCMDKDQRNVVIFKFEDFEKDMEKLNIVMSSKVAYERARKQMMFDVVLDPVDLDT